MSSSLDSPKELYKTVQAISEKIRAKESKLQEDEKEVNKLWEIYHATQRALAKALTQKC